MEELIPIIVWGLLIFLFSSGRGKKKVGGPEAERRRRARQERVEAMRRRLQEEADIARRSADRRREREAVALEDPPDARPEGRSSPAIRDEAPVPAQPERQPQVPTDVWDLIQVLATGGAAKREQEPARPIPQPTPVEDPVAEARELVVRERREPARSRDVRPSTRTDERRARRSRKAVAEARSDAGLSAVDAAEHREEADAHLTEVDDAEHSRVEASLARARSRRNAGKLRRSHGLFGLSGTQGLRRAVLISEVLGTPTALRSPERRGPHEPPE